MICRIFIINPFKILSDFYIYLTIGYWACFLISKHMRFLILLHCVQRTCSVHFSSLKFIETCFVAQHMVSFVNRTVDTPLTNSRAPRLPCLSCISFYLLPESFPSVYKHPIISNIFKKKKIKDSLDSISTPNLLVMSLLAICLSVAPLKAEILMLWCR